MEHIRLKNKIYIVAAAVLFVTFGHTLARADDSIVIKCSNTVDRGKIILDNPPIMNCKDMEMVKMFVGSALSLGPIPNVEALAEQLEALAKPEPKTDPDEVFKQRKEKAFSEI